jgi:hypothetical protein
MEAVPMSDQQTTIAARTPGEVPHPSTFIQEEMDARGWDRWAVAHRMGGDAAMNRLTLDMYFEVGPGKTNMRLGEATARQLGNAFDVSPQFFLNLEAAWIGAHGRH